MFILFKNPFTLFILFIFLISCRQTKPSIESPPSTTSLYSEQEAKVIIQDSANKALVAIKNLDFTTLAAFVHPRKGVLFSPYATIGESPHLVFSRGFIVNIPLYPDRKLIWGIHDGDGKDIQLSVKKYFQQYVFSRDFTLDKNPSYNQKNQLGTSINNVFEIYPTAIVVDYYDRGSPEADGMGWRYLRLVFEKENNDWFLVAIINDQWTT